MKLTIEVPEEVKWENLHRDGVGSAAAIVRAVLDAYDAQQPTKAGDIVSIYDHNEIYKVLAVAASPTTGTPILLLFNGAVTPQVRAEFIGNTVRVGK